MKTMSKRAFRLWALALPILTVVPFCAPSQAQRAAGGKLNPGRRAPLGGRVDPGGANGRSALGGKIDPGGYRTPLGGTGVRVGSDGANVRSPLGGSGIRIGSDGANVRATLGGGGTIDPSGRHPLGGFKPGSDTAGGRSPLGGSGVRIGSDGANVRATLGGGVRIGSDGANERSPLGGKIDPGGYRTPLGGTGVRIGSDGANRQEVLPQPEPTSELLVFMQPGANAAHVAFDHGMTVLYTLPSDPNAYVLRAASPEQAIAAYARMAQDQRVRAAYPNSGPWME